MPTLAQSATGTIDFAASPTVTFAAAPAVGDVVTMFVGVDGAPAISIPAGWNNVLGGTTVVTGDNTALALWHVVDGTDGATYTLTDLLPAGSRGAVIGAHFTSADTTTFVDATNTTFNIGNASPHIVLGVAGADVADGSLVVAFDSAQGNPPYGAPSAGWTKQAEQIYSNVTSAVLCTHDTLTATGVTVADGTISPGTPTEYEALTVAVLAGEVAAPTFYVSTTGNDTTGDGSQANPWATISHGVGQLGPGNTLLVQPGTYSDYVTSDGTDAGFALQVTAGTAADPVVVRADGGVVTLVGRWQTRGQSHWTIDGIDVDWDGVSTDSLVVLRGGVGWQWLNSDVGNSHGSAGIFVGVDGSLPENPDQWRIAHCFVHDTADTGGGNQDHCIYVHNDTPSGETGLIEFCIMADSPNGRGVKLGPGAAGQSVPGNVTVRYCTMIRNAGPSNVQASHETTGCTVERCILEGPTENPLNIENITAFELSGINNVAQDNIGWESAGVVETVSGTGNAWTDAGGNLFLDPQLDLEFRPQNPDAFAYGFDPLFSGPIQATTNDSTADLNGTVVNPAGDRTGTIQTTTGDATADLTGETTVPAFTGAIDATTGDATADLTGQTTVPGVTGSIEATTDGSAAALAGTTTVPAFVGAIAASTQDATADLTGATTVPAFTGSIDTSTVAAVADLNGINSSPGETTGSIAVTTANATADLTGGTTVPTIGTLDATTADATADLAGATTVPAFVATITATTGDTTSTISGSFTPPAFAGAILAVLADAAADLSGTTGVPTFTGTFEVVLADATMAIALAGIAPDPDRTVAVPRDRRTATVDPDRRQADVPREVRSAAVPAKERTT